MAADDTYIYLRKRDPARNMARYYMLSVQPNLFGGYSVIREWGWIGQGGQVRIAFYESRQEAFNSLVEKPEEKKQRGYA